MHDVVASTGQRVMALVQVCPGAELPVADITAHVRERLAGYKAPKTLMVVPKVPRFPNGKPDFQGAQAIALELT